MIREPAALDLRPFSPAADFPAVVDLISEVNAHDGMDWFPTVVTLALDWAPSPSFDPARDVTVVEVDGRLVAAGVVNWRERSGKIIHNLEIWVRPEARRNWLGSRVLAWLEARARASVDEGGGGQRDLAHFLGGGADEANDASVAFATSSGYAPVRYGFEMRRPLDLPIPEAALPERLEIRPVREDHHGRSGLPTSRRSSTTGSRASAKRPTISASSATPTAIPRCGWWRGMATKSPAAS